MSSSHSFIPLHLWCIPFRELFGHVKCDFLLPHFLLSCDSVDRRAPRPRPKKRKAGSTPSPVKTPPPRAIDSRRSPSASFSINHTSSSTSGSSRVVVGEKERSFFEGLVARELCVVGSGCDWRNGEGEARSFLVGGFEGIGCCCVWGRSGVGRAEEDEEEAARTIRRPPASSTPFTIHSNTIRSATTRYKHDRDVHLRLLFPDAPNFYKSNQRSS